MVEPTPPPWESPPSQIHARSGGLVREGGSPSWLSTPSWERDGAHLQELLLRSCGEREGEREACSYARVRVRDGGGPWERETEERESEGVTREEACREEGALLSLLRRLGR